MAQKEETYKADEIISVSWKIARRINNAITILFISITNAYISKCFIGPHDPKGGPVDITIGYGTAIAGLAASIIFSGRLKLFKGLSLTTTALTLVIVNKFGHDSLSWTCLLVSVYIQCFIMLRRYSDYTNVPFSLIVGLKLTFAVFIFLQLFLLFPTSLNFPVKMNLLTYFAFTKEHAADIDFVKMTLLLVLAITFAVLNKFFRYFPWNTFVIVMSVLVYLIMKNVEEVQTLDSVMVLNLNFGQIGTIFKKNLQNLRKIDLLYDSTFWMYTLILSIVIWYESMVSVKYVKGVSNKRSNCKYESYGLLSANLLSAFFGLLPISAGMVNMIQLKAVNSLTRLTYVISLVLVILVPLGLFGFVKFIPVTLLPFLFASMLVSEINHQDYAFLYNNNKKKLFYVSVIPILAIWFDISFAFIFAMILYHVFYSLGFTETIYSIDDPDVFFSRIIKKAQSFKKKQLDEERQSLRFTSYKVEMEELRDRIKDNCVVYTLQGCNNYHFASFHINVIKNMKENYIIINLEKLFKNDIDFIGDYYKLLSETEKLDKDLYLSGLPKSFLKSSRRIRNSFFRRYYEENRVLFLS